MIPGLLTPSVLAADVFTTTDLIFLALGAVVVVLAILVSLAMLAAMSKYDATGDLPIPTQPTASDVKPVIVTYDLRND